MIYIEIPYPDNIIDKDDFIIYLSGSGNSLNLVKCARKAKTSGIKQAAIVGFNGGALKKLVDFPVHVNFDDMEISEDGDFIVTNKILTSLEKNKDKYLFNQINLLDNKEISTAMELVELNLRNILAHYLYIDTEDAKIGDTILFKDIMLPTQMYYDKNLPLWENKATFSEIYKDENKENL